MVWALVREQSLVADQFDSCWDDSCRDGDSVENSSGDGDVDMYLFPCTSLVCCLTVLVCTPGIAPSPATPKRKEERSHPCTYTPVYVC